MRATSFLTLAPGTPVVDRFGERVGKVDRVLVLVTGGFDGIVVKTDAGTRFVDTPEVRRISAGAVTLGITVDDVVNPGPNARRIYAMPEARYDRPESPIWRRLSTNSTPPSRMCPFPDARFVSQATIHSRRKP